MATRHKSDKGEAGPDRACCNRSIQNRDQIFGLQAVKAKPERRARADHARRARCNRSLTTQPHASLFKRVGAKPGDKGEPTSAPSPLQQELDHATTRIALQAGWSEATKWLDSAFQVAESFSEVKHKAEQGPVVSHVDQNACGHGIGARTDHRQCNAHPEQD
jgi:hypothetical protein